MYAIIAKWRFMMMYIFAPQLQLISSIPNFHGNKQCGTNADHHEWHKFIFVFMLVFTPIIVKL